MAVLSNIIRSSNEVEVIVPSESFIPLLDANYVKLVSDIIVNKKALAPGKGNTANWSLSPLTSGPASGSFQAEGEDDQTITALTVTEVVMSTEWYTLAHAVSDQAQSRAVFDVEDIALVSLVNAMADSRDVVVLTEFTNATNNEASPTEAFSVQKFDEAQYQFKLLSPKQGSLGFATVLHSSQMKQLMDDIGSAGGGIYANPFSGGADLSAMFNGLDGEHGVYRGYKIMESLNVPEFNATAWEGAMLSIGQGNGALGFCFETGVGGTEFSFRITGPGSEAAQRLQTKLSAHSHYAATITNQANILSIQSLKA